MVIVKPGPVGVLRFPNSEVEYKTVFVMLACVTCFVCACTSIAMQTATMMLE